MKRRDFMQKTVITSGAVMFGAITGASAFGKLVTNQKFNFMAETHPNLTLVNSFFKAYGDNDSDAIKKIVAEDIKWHVPGKHPFSGTKTGVTEVLAFFKQLNKGLFKAVSIVLGVNDSFVIDCHRNWSNIEGEENLDAMSCLLWKIENNKIIEVYNFPEDQHKVDSFFTKLYG